MSDATFPQQPYTKVRVRKYAYYDRETIFDILDCGLVGHFGFLASDRPMVIPMAYARIDETIYIHGAKAGRIVKANEDGVPASLTVTHVDGIVAGRSAFHHSINYRSVVVHGQVRLVLDPIEKEAAFVAITNHLLPGRWDEVRPMKEKEFNATGVLAIDIEGATAKMRQGPPKDDDEDYELPVWGGVVPVIQSLGQPLDDGRLRGSVKTPSSLGKAIKKFA